MLSKLVKLQNRPALLNCPCCQPKSTQKGDSSQLGCNSLLELFTQTACNLIHEWGCGQILVRRDFGCAVHTDGQVFGHVPSLNGLYDTLLKRGAEVYQLLVVI